MDTHGKELPTTSDPMALAQAIGKLTNASTFSDVADMYCSAIFSRFMGLSTRVDVVFDTYWTDQVRNTRTAYQQKKENL